jgi:hypothetical protein
MATGVCTQPPMQACGRAAYSCFPIVAFKLRKILSAMNRLLMRELRWLESGLLSQRRLDYTS